MILAWTILTPAAADPPPLALRRAAELFRWLQSGPYLAEIYIFAAVPTFHKNLAAGDAFSSEAEQKKTYMEILHSKLKQGLTGDDWLDLQSSQPLGQQVLNDVAQKLAERIQ